MAAAELGMSHRVQFRVLLPWLSWYQAETEVTGTGLSLAYLVEVPETLRFLPSAGGGDMDAAIWTDIFASPYFI